MSEGKSLKNVYIYLPTSIFFHGQLYVLLYQELLQENV